MSNDETTGPVSAGTANGDTGNGSTPAAAAASGPATVGIVAQYIKDLSFENPGAPDSLRGGGAQPRLDLNINVGARTLDAENYEVTLTINAQANKEDKTTFAIELVYAGLFRLTNVPRQQLQPFLLIEGPRILFPFARQIVAETSRNGGFPPVMLDPIDFAAMYRRGMEKQAAQAASVPTTAS